MYRRVNAVVAWWDEDDCIVRNYARGTEWRAGPAELAVLGALSTWQDAADLARRLGLARAAGNGIPTVSGSGSGGGLVHSSCCTSPSAIGACSMVRVSR